MESRDNRMDLDYLKHKLNISILYIRSILELKLWYFVIGSFNIIFFRTWTNMSAPTDQFHYDLYKSKRLTKLARFTSRRLISAFSCCRLQDVSLTNHTTSLSNAVCSTSNIDIYFSCCNISVLISLAVIFWANNLSQV